MKDTKAIITLAYPEVELKFKSGSSKYKQYISKFISSRNTLLYSNIPSKQIYFSASDSADFFNSMKIDRGIINNAISKTYYNEISNFNPSYAKDDTTIALLCAVRYYFLKNMKKELELALINISFSGKFYPSIWYGSFPYEPQEHVMEYAITHMANNKYDIVREGNVIGAIKSIANTWINTYKDRFRKFSDEDATYLLQQLHNRMRSFMNNIASLYYKASEDKNLILTYDSDDISEDEYRLADSDAFRLNRYVENTMTYLNSHNIDYKACKMASNDIVKMDELKGIIQNILSENKNLTLVKEYISLIIVCYFNGSDSKSKNVKDIDFITYSIKPKPNTKDKYELRKKEILEILLVNNSQYFNRRRNRAASESAYYRSINAYFALVIQNAN